MDGVSITCPHCLQSFEVSFETDVSGNMVYDCEICCRPLALLVRWKKGELQVSVQGE